MRPVNSKRAMSNAAASVEPYCRHLLGLAYRLLGSMADAEDALQKTYLRWHEADRERRSTVMHADTQKYNEAQSPEDRDICELLARAIDRTLPEADNKIWHARPVWFLDGNPVVGYSKLKDCIRLLFWSGQSFDEEGLKKEGSFKAAGATYTAPDEVTGADLERWLAKARDIQHPLRYVPV